MTCSSYISGRIQKHLKKWLLKLGIQIYFHPYLFLLSGFLLTGICCLGLLNLHYENRIQYLWLPRNSDLWQNFETYIKYYGEPEPTMILMIKDLNNENLLTPTRMTQLFEIFQISTNDSKISSDPWNFDNVCARQYPGYPYCDSIHENLFIFWNNNPSYWTTQESIEYGINTNRDNILYFLGGLKTNTIAIANETTDSDMITGGSYVQMYYTLEGTSNMTLFKGQEELCQEFVNYWQEHSESDVYSDNNLGISFFTTFSIEAEVDRLVSSDQNIWIFAFLIMLVTLTLILGGLTCVEAKVMLVLSSLGITGCALAIGCGLGSALGFDFNLLVLLIPFILLGVGIDDDLS